MKARNSLLIAAATLIVIMSLVIGSRREGAEFAGSDGQATATITAMRPDYQPWFKPFWEPPSREIESLLFTLQAALGSGLLGYYIGLRRGQSQSRQRDQDRAGD